MNSLDINRLITSTWASIRKSPILAGHTDSTLQIPKPFYGTVSIKLIILGQDPTVKNVSGRKDIKTVLNLDKSGALKKYLNYISSSLGLDLEKNVYATNLLKNFFIAPPASIKEVNIFQLFIPYWLPVLRKELELFPTVPIISLGEPLLQNLVLNGISKKVREYWGFADYDKTGDESNFKISKLNENILNRVLIPFPHQPSINRKFYKNTLDSYLRFIKSEYF